MKIKPTYLMKTAIAALISISFVVAGFAAAANAEPGRVIATCKLVNKATVKMFGHVQTITGIQWHVNEDLVDLSRLRQSDRNDRTRHYASLNPDAGKSSMASASLQNANKQVLGTMRLVQKGHVRFFGKKVGMNEVVFKRHHRPDLQPEYRLVKIDGKLNIAHADPADTAPEDSRIQVAALTSAAR